ncbi:T9SS type A sorting domain-containing protein [Flavobacterium sp. J49]|uniref:DUF7619 domain-containing protein n=1 Tax=Flavobacterium sp. J49 TaxID=2718534 RepID=UPI001593E8D2|nr:T9SS type A sorting domain-containing protein [Flavobacterium sp. J49]MBF6640256.1 T9SS type A sorting domain-containing protein [Flavobacterium sp. J49]NIC01501.1 T9SS type A sorting domain-containing protein [Flavobacterium sp. J49]
MKKLYFLLLLMSGLVNAQIVNIPDANFKARLLAANSTVDIAKDSAGNNIAIDQNADGEIQVSEALLVYSLNNLNYSSQFPIYDLTGIQSFQNITLLNSGTSYLTTLDLSNMPNLEILFCGGSNLTSLNVNGCSSLIQIVSENSQLTSLDLSGLSQLVYVYVDNNLLQNINLTGTTSLTTLSCAFNSLTTLDVSSCTNLQSLYCPFNQLTSINFTGLTAIESLYLHSNQLTNLDFSNMPNLSYVNCSANLLTTVDVSNNHNFTTLICTDSPNLVSVFMKFGRPALSINGGYPLTNNPNLQYVCMDEYRIPGFLQYFQENGMSNVVVNSYCSFTPGGNYNTITGTVTVDNDNNGCDTGDGFNPYIRMNIAGFSGPGATFTNAQGQYTFYTLSGNFTINPSIENPSWFTVSPQNANINFANFNNNVVTQNFCIAPNGIHPDLEIVVAPVNQARPGFDAVYKIVYRNKGNQTLSQQYGVNFFFNQNLMELVSTSVTPSTSGPGSLSWDYANLRPFESRAILVTFNINAPTDTNPVNIGDILNYTASILPQAGDEDTMNNLCVYNEMVSGSFDPNDITCIEGNIVAPSEIGDYLHYMIRFENTGTAEAENIVVRTDINPADFDVSSLQLLSASHDMYTRVTGNTVEFIFENILLESGGHGNVLLKVKSVGSLQQGDNVNKRANIYFDYNYPLETNDYETIFQALSNPNFESDRSISIYPNPSSGVVYIKGDFNIKSIQLFDVQGRLLQTNIVNENNTTIDIAAQNVGVYFVRVVSDKGIKVEKLVKQ